jgi:phosphoribosyl 1,2-cyclic phosphodiesterase
VILTHTHSDHWKDSSIAELRDRRIPLYGHAKHFEYLERSAKSFADFAAAGLAREFRETGWLEFSPALACLPVRVSHDSLPTFAFRIEGRDAEPGPAWAIGYASDLGCGSPELISAFAGVDVLALEYNHDIMLERNSPRPRFLVNRVLGDEGHLSNTQAAELTRTIAGLSGEGFPSTLFQLHLSSDCNKPELAAVAGREALVALNPATEVITARQEIATKTVLLKRRTDAASRAVARVQPHATKPRTVQPSLPGFDDDEW